MLTIILKLDTLSVAEKAVNGMISGSPRILTHPRDLPPYTVTRV